LFEELIEKEQVILRQLSDQGSLNVAQLATDLGVSAVTIRSYLNNLEEKGLVKRTHGGVVPAMHGSILEKQMERVEEKNRIAKAAAELVRDGNVIMIEAGTTTALVVRHLIGKRDVHVVTNSTLVFNYARLNPALQITLTGGEFRRPTESLVGPIALETIHRLNVRLAFVGTDGFSLGKGMTTHLFEGAEIVKAMREHAETTVLVADSTKHGRAGFVKVLDLNQVGLIITDKGLDAVSESGLTEAGIRLRLV
jgi:DeoR family transcriptional regulator, galactitol utilization operon repressor